MSRKPDFFYRKKGKVRPGFIRRGRRKIAVGEGLTKSQAERRVYPQTGSWDSDHDTDELIQAIKRDPNISDQKRRKRLQLLYSLTYRKGFSEQYKGNITEARAKLKRAYQEYTKD